MVQFDEDKQNRRIADLKKKEEEDLVQILSAKYGIEYINLTALPINGDALKLIDENKAIESKVAAFEIIDKKVRLAIRFPDNQNTLSIINDLKTRGFDVELYITSTQSLEKAWKIYKDLSFASESKGGSLDISNEEIASLVDKVKNIETIKSVLNETIDSKKTYRVTRIIETITAGALALDASDIHIEPEEKFIRLRYRLDGVLSEITSLGQDTFALMLSRIKLISGLKLNIHDNSQDGRFSIRLPMGDIEVRVSILPGPYGESVVMRLLNPKSINVPLEELGIPKKLLSVLQEEINRPDGMILTTGPTGSGKTTTLYAFLKKIYNPEVKIITIEDPIEYHLQGIVQSQVNDKGYNFAEGLRAAVRQDPDIIMVGEIRDNETASMAIDSALTGHLVFSTLHTNDAAGTFPRLIDLGVNPKVLTSAIRIAMAQRLVRKLCVFCKKEITLDGSIKKDIEDTLSSIEDKSEIPQNVDKMWVSVGCEKCHNTGYKGRIGIYEAIRTNGVIETAIENNPSEREIWNAAKGQGILTMKQDGVLKVLSGTTSFEELQRVISIKD
jgi:type IV pilus assembly protein PilB